MDYGRRHVESGRYQITYGKRTVALFDSESGMVAIRRNKDWVYLHMAELRGINNQVSQAACAERRKRRVSDGQHCTGR